MKRQQGEKVDPSLLLMAEEPIQKDNPDNYLQTGYDPDTNTWEVIVKYHGDILPIATQLQGKVEILNEQYAIFTLPEDNVDALANYAQIEYIERPKTLGPALNQALNQACILPVQNFPPLNLKGNGVLIGILDTGIEYTHPDFIDESGNSRIAFLWDQTIPGNPPEGFTEGTEYTRDQINEAIKSNNPYEIVPHRDSSGHGTHVAGIAAGNGRGSNGLYTGVAPEAELIIVKLGQKGAKSFPRTTEIMRGLRYLIEKARDLQKPIAINLSFGTNEGGHDGNSLFESYIDDQVREWKTIMSVATGNEGNSGHHTSGVLSQGEKRDVEVQISPQNTPIALEIWKSFIDTYSFSITAPSGKTSPIINPKVTKQQVVLDNTNIDMYFGGPNPFNRDEQFFVVLSPREDMIDGGVWKLTLYADQVVNGIYNIWLPVREVLAGDTRFLQPVVEQSLTVPSTAINVISVGAYNAVADNIAPFSGRGYTRGNQYIKPEIVAPGVDIRAPFIGGGYDVLSGTSMATPFVTGAAALLMEWGIVKGNDPFMYGAKIKALLSKGAKRDKVNVQYPNPTWGYGILCLQNSFDLVRKEEDSRRKEEKEDIQVVRKEKSLRSKREEIILKRQIQCTEAILSNDYLDYIVEYEGLLTEDMFQEQNICIQILSETYAIFHIPKQIGATFFEGQPRFRYFEMSYAYGLYSVETLQAGNILPFHTSPYLPLRGEGVLIGIIDSGIDYMHPDFMYEDNTSRIARIWDQTIQGNPPMGFSYGTEYNQEQINEAIAVGTQGGNPREVVPHVDEIGHGTYSAGIAGGRGLGDPQYIGAAPDAEFLVVKLKDAKQSVRDEFDIPSSQSGIYQESDILMALKYLTQTAISLGKPIAILMGMGSNKGGHDGTTTLESYMEELGGRRGIIIVTPAGDEGNTQRHTSGVFQNTGEEKRIEFRVAEGQTGLELDIWNHAPDRMSISITSPGGEFIERIPARFREVEEIKLVLEQTRIFVEYRYPEERTGDQWIKINFENPTPGNWVVTLHGDFIVDGRYDAWLPRTDWVQPETAFLSPVPETTITVPGTAIDVLTAGAYNHVDNSLYSPSGRGTTRDGRIKPDLVAPGVNVTGPVPGGGYAAKTGTSVAAAHLAGVVALLLDWAIIKGNDPVMYTRKARTYLIRGARRRPGENYPNREWGYGILDLSNVFIQLRGN